MGSLPASSSAWARSCTCRRTRCVRQLDLHKGYPYDLVVVKEDVSKKVVSYILEHQLSFPGVEVQQSYLRDYPYGDLAAHVLGYLGEIIARRAQAAPVPHAMRPGDVIGVAGVE